MDLKINLDVDTTKFTDALKKAKEKLDKMVVKELEPEKFITNNIQLTKVYDNHLERLDNLLRDEIITNNEFIGLVSEFFHLLMGDREEL